MSFYIAGVNHDSCPVEVRERLSAFGALRASRLVQSRGWGEVAVLSTCNRFELYAGGKPACGTDSEKTLIEVLTEISQSDVTRHIYGYSEEAAVRHLFRVAAGLDSLVLGETEILGQVKTSYENARDGGTTKKRLNVLFQRALFVGKSVRYRTNISMGQVSVASVAVELAKRIFGRLSERTVLVLGAGDMAEKTARHLQAAKAARICLANRTWAKAAALAEKLTAEAVPWDGFPKRIEDADIVVASTGSLEPVLTLEMAERAAAVRGGRPLFIIDIAMPRDVAAGVHSIDGVYVYDLQDLKAIVDENFSRRSAEIKAAETILSAESSKLGRWLAALDAGNELSLKHSDLAGRRDRASV